MTPRDVDEDDPVLETITLADLRALPAIDESAGDWAPPVPPALLEVLDHARKLAGADAEALLSSMLETHCDDPEPWWGMALAMAKTGDLRSAATCYENFRDRVAHQMAMALDDASEDLNAAVARLTRLSPSLRRCRDHLLVARAEIAFAGLLLGIGNPAAAEAPMRRAIGRLRALWPRPWPILAEWLASAAIARVDAGATARAVRTLALALRLSQHDAENVGRTAMIARDLGVVLDRLDRLAEAEAMLDQARTLAASIEDRALRASVATARARNLGAQRRYVEAQAELTDALAMEPPARERIDALLGIATLNIRLDPALRDSARLDQARSSALEAAELLENLGGDPRPAWREIGTIAVLMGDMSSARDWLFRVLRAQPYGTLSAGERIALSYIPYLLRLAEGAYRKALFWAERRLVWGEQSAAALRDIMILREHCIAASGRVGDAARVRVHALAMLRDEAAMLRCALGRERGPADWNRLRLAREGLSVLAWMERSATDAEAPWRLGDALLSGRGLARGARRNSRAGLEAATTPSLRFAVGKLQAGQAVLALVALHPPRPVDPARPMRNGFLPPLLVALLHRFGDAVPTILELGDFALAAQEVEQWRNSIALGRAAMPPPRLAALLGPLATARRIFFLGEGSFEALPLRLFAPEAEIVQCATLAPSTAYQSVAGVAPVQALVAEDMLVEQDWRAATENELAAIGAVTPVTIVSAAGMTRPAILASLARSRRLHIIAHGDALREPAQVDLDVYDGAAIALTDEIRLSAGEIAGQRLEALDLVVLSSCDTGLGVHQQAEGMASMAAAFLDAGANCVIASLWPVPHEATAQFMGILYRELQHHGSAAALCRAQKLALAEGLPTRCWAAWTLHGHAPV